MPKPTPFPVTVDVILIAECAGDPRVLLIERAHEPFAGRHAFPGGFVDPGEVVDRAARRELAEETSLEGLEIDLEQVGAYGPAGGRDPRGETLTVAFLGVVPEPLRVLAADDAAAAEWVPLDTALRPGYLAFDHARILGDAVKRWRAASTLSFWDARYAAQGQMWSGAVNASLARAVTELGLEPGRALDLGSGEGGDVIWLAEHGWQAVGVEVSRVAVERARAAVVDRALPEGRAIFLRADLADLAGREASRVSVEPRLGEYELVTASFFQSPVDLPREVILREMARRVIPGGHLVVIAHASKPPWSHSREGDAETGSHGADAGAHRHAHFPTPEEEVAALALDPAEWSIVTAGLWPRTVVSPDGEAAEIHDSVVIARRLSH